MTRDRFATIITRLQKKEETQFIDELLRLVALILNSLLVVAAISERKYSY